VLKILSLIVFVTGGVLLVYGLTASHSVASITRAVNGAPTDKGIWLVVAGIVGLVVGGFGLVFLREP